VDCIQTDHLALGMRHVIATCGLRISTPLKFIDLMNDHEDDYDEVNDSNELDFEAILRVAAKHGLKGTCIAAEVKVQRSPIGHFINIQRSRPETWRVEGSNEWRDEDDAHATQDLWKMKDFQIHCDQTHENLRGGTVRLLMGRLQEVSTVFGTAVDPNWAKEPKYQAMRGLQLRTEWEDSESRWTDLSTIKSTDLN